MLGKRGDGVLIVAGLLIAAGIASIAIAPAQKRRLARLETLARSASAAPGGVLRPSEIAQIEGIVLRAAKDAGAAITGLEADRTPTGAVLVEYALQIDARGRYHDLGAFVTALEHLPWMSRLSELKIERLIDGSGVLRVRLSVPMAVGMS